MTEPELAPVEHAKCDGCDVLTRADCLEDCSDLSHLLGLCCESCADDAVADAHERDNGDCKCEVCLRVYARAERLRRAMEARVRGGVSVAGLRLVGLDGGEDA